MLNLFFLILLLYNSIQILYLARCSPLLQISHPALDLANGYNATTTFIYLFKYLSNLTLNFKIMAELVKCPIVYFGLGKPLSFEDINSIFVA